MSFSRSPLAIVAGCVAMTLVLCAADDGFASQVGDTVLVTTQDGSMLRGKLLEKTPDGFLMQIKGKRLLIRYEHVQRMETLSAAAKPRSDPTYQPKGEPAPAPTYDRTAAPRRAPADGSRRRRSAVARGAVPPRPRVAGRGMIVAGWLMFGGGTVIWFAATVSGEGDLIVPSGLIATSGLILAVVGHIRRGVSNGRARRWDRRYRRYGMGPVLYENHAGTTLSLDPMSQRPDADGFALTLRF